MPDRAKGHRVKPEGNKQLPYMPTCRRLMLRFFSSILLLALYCSMTSSAFAEYGDVVLNNTAKAANMNPVIFPHWIHRMKYSCRACHETLGFKMKAGTSGITMQKIFAGQYCGVCHNAKTAFGTFQCQFCHSGKKDLETQVHRSTKQTLVSPLE